MRMMWCNTELIATPIQVALCMSEKQYKKEMKRAKIVEPGPFLLADHTKAAFHFYTDGDGNALGLICIGDTKGMQYEVVASLIVHEAVHVWQRIRERLGEHSPSYEFEAYSIQRIVQNLLCDYRRYLGKKKK